MFEKRRQTDSGTSGGDYDPRGSKKQRVADCVKVLLDIATESADWFPPLKSALGGVNALIKHYEEFKDVREKIENLVPQLDRFKQSITTAADDKDPEETTRRRRLISTFKEVEHFSKKLLAKNVIARLADKGEDSKIVTRLIERLREAIFCYQVSQQQAIYHQITHLASSFDTFLKIQEKTPTVMHKLESIIARLNRLGDAPWEELQHERWTKLFADLRPIRDAAKGLYKRIATEGYTEDDADVVAVSRLAEDLRDVLFVYWMVQQQEVYDQNCELIETAELSVLNNCRRAQAAEYRHGNRRGCLKGTRETVLNEVELWAKDFDKSPVFWLNGLAGTGKSTIAQTVAERLFAEESLGASFFCSRDFEDRSNLNFIFPTLAFQLAHRYPNFRSRFVSILRSNPDVAHESLYSQIQKLIVQPLQSTGASAVIVIDALDECKDDEPTSTILSVLGRFVNQIPRVKFFITGRPEPRIKTGFRLPLLVDSTDVFVLHDVHPSLISNDIHLFLKHELSELAWRRQLGGWPGEENIDLLCHRAAGLFVYAVATVKFLDSNAHLPEHRLRAILQLPDSTAPEGRTRFNHKTTLDSLYTSILQSAFSEEDPDSDSRVRTTIGTITLVVNSLPPSAIAELVGLDPKEVVLFITLIQSLLAIGEDFNQPVKPFHKSFPDFITDPSRCVNPRFHISPGLLHLELVTNCLRVINGELEQNMLSLPEYALNSEVKDLQARIDSRVSIALQYACRSWHNHLTETQEDIADVISLLRVFLEVKFLAWLEVLSVLRDLGAAAVALEKLMTWLEEVAKNSEFLDTVRDYFYFLTKFFEPINVSATHVYHSALELCPTSSIVRRMYYHRSRRATCLPRVAIGTPHSWDQTASISGKDHDYESSIWSPCGQFLAVKTLYAIEILNQLTFELLTTLGPTETTHPLTGPIAYSPDGRSLACASGTTIIIWDIQTGGVVKEIECATSNISMAWSADGRTIGVIGTIHWVGAMWAHIYHVASGTALSPGERLCETCGTNSYIWTHEKSFRVITPTSAFIDIFEVGHTPSKILSLRSPSPHFSSSNVSFSPTTCHVSVSSGGALRILQGPVSGHLLDETGSFFSHCFSSDGSFFAASKEGSIHIWKYTSGRYAPWREFQCKGWTDSLRFSPASTSILGLSGGVLRVWRLDDLPVAPKTSRQEHIGLSCSGNHLVTTSDRGTIVITDILSQAVSQLIDTGGVVAGLVVTGNVLVAIGLDTTMAWLLTEQGTVDGVFGSRVAHRGDRIWAKQLPFGEGKLAFKVEGQVGAIERGGSICVTFHTETGEVPRFGQEPQRFASSWNLFGQTYRGRDYLRLHNIPQPNISPEDTWQVSRATIREGWVKDPRGRRRLWVPIEWRTSWDSLDWRHDVMIQFGILGGGPVIIKF